MFNNIKIENFYNFSDFYNKDKASLLIKATYEEIRRSKNKNPLYKNLKSNTLNLDERAIAISSFVTKLYISCKRLDNETGERIRFMELSGIEDYNNAVLKYYMFNNKKGLIEALKEIRETFDNLGL